MDPSSSSPMPGSNELKKIFAFLLDDTNVVSMKIMDNNLYALIFIISSHTLISKLIPWQFIDYTTLSGYSHQAKLKKMKMENKGAIDDIGYIFECCLNNGTMDKSIFNHTINIPRYLIIHYFHQCILYLTPFTFNIHQLIHILLSNMYLPSGPPNDNKFDAEFFTSFTILFRSISGNIHTITNIDKSKQDECHKMIQFIAMNDILESYKTMKKKLEFEPHQLLYIGYICALCGILSTKKNIGSFKHEPDIEQMEKSLCTQIQTEISYIIGNIQSLNNKINRSYPGAAQQRLSWMKSIMSATGILCNFNEYFLNTDYIKSHAFYFLDFLFDTLLQSIIEIVTTTTNISSNNDNSFISYLNQCGYTISKLMSITFEYNNNFTNDDINQQQYQMETE